MSFRSAASTTGEETTSGKQSSVVSRTRQEVNMGKIAEVCMVGREMVKQIVQLLNSQIVSVVVLMVI